jgi:nitroreductase
MTRQFANSPIRQFTTSPINNMNTIKLAATRYPVNETSMTRWSPRAFADRPVEKEKLRSLFEAARWSPSSSNQQPWRFIIGFKGDATWQKIFDTLDEWNQLWASCAPVFLLSIGRKKTEKSGRDNFHYAYDTGQSVAHLTFEAMQQGLYVHQMGGFNHEKAKELLEIPEPYEPVTVIVTGYEGDPEILLPDYKKTELEHRMRKDFEEIVFSGKFGETSGLFND